MKRAEVFWAACGGAFVLWVIYLSLTPDPIRAPTVDEFKTGHILAYFWLMLWFAQLAKSLPWRIVTAVLLCLLGIGLEYAQLATGYRHFSPSDMVDDALGVGLGLLLAHTPAGRVLEKVRALF